LLFGDNIVGYKWLPFAFGLLTIALTYAVARKMFGVRVALLAAALLAVSFWPIMYSRFGVRHIGTLPWMLGAFYLLYPSASLGNRRRSAARELATTVIASICLAAALMTYFAGRAVPIVLVGFLVYLLIFQRTVFKQVWRRYFVAIGMAVLIALPMFVEIANTPGSEKRTEVVGGPLIELRKGHVQPTIDTTLSTLGMFTFAGDPESLYNLPGRPVFDWITGIFFYLGIIFCLIRLRHFESGFALIWLIVGLAPAFVSIPAASFSHTIAALPVVYIIAAVGAVAPLSWLSDKMTRGSQQDDKMRSASKIVLSPFQLIVMSALITISAYLTIRDYFGTWANDPFVRFQYHAPTREVAEWLNSQSVTDVAIGTNPNELALDPVALRLDMPRHISARWFNAEAALVRLDNGPTLFTAMQAPGSALQQVLTDQGEFQMGQTSFKAYTIQTYPRIAPLDGTFDGGHLILRGGTGVPDQVRPGDTLTWRTYWLVSPPLSQPRLKMFLHVLNDQGKVIIGSDREDINFATLRSNDAFLQISQIKVPGDLQPGQYPVEIGWYNPETGERLKRDDGSDRFLLTPLEVIAP
jgi:hypothetical protein